MGLSAYGAYDIIFRNDMIVSAVILAQYGAVLPGDEAAQSFQGVSRTLPGRIFPGLLDLLVFYIQSIVHDTGKEAALADGAYHLSLPEYGQVLHIVFSA